MSEERIISQHEADNLTATSKATRVRMERKGLFPRRFQITENGSTGYLWSEIQTWIEARAANRTQTRKIDAALAALKKEG